MFVAFDLETTGVDPFSDVPVSYAIVGEDYALVELVNPGRPIPSGASAIHGITDDMVANAISIDTAIELIVDSLHQLWDEHLVLVGMNVSYDLTIVATLAERLQIPFKVGPVLDVLVLDRHYDKWRKGKRNLESLCKWYGVELKDAHSADADASACLEILTKMRGRYPFNFSLKGNDLLREWYRDWLGGYSRYLEGLGKAPIPSGRYEWPVHARD
jgi:DNA polymerase III subunit epsilon